MMKLSQMYALNDEDSLLETMAGTKRQSGRRIGKQSAVAADRKNYSLSFVIVIPGKNGYFSECGGIFLVVSQCLMQVTSSRLTMKLLTFWQSDVWRVLLRIRCSTSACSKHQKVREQDTITSLPVLEFQECC
jgi:hypothetical protein